MHSGRKAGCNTRRRSGKARRTLRTEQPRRTMMNFDVWGEVDLVLRLLAGMTAGIVVGWERTIKQRAAGIRTFGLVGLGTAAAATIFSEPHEADAPSRGVP